MWLSNVNRVGGKFVAGRPHAPLAIKFEGTNGHILAQSYTRGIPRFVSKVSVLDKNQVVAPKHLHGHA